jgi:hypothetical protein
MIVPIWNVEGGMWNVKHGRAKRGSLLSDLFDFPFLLLGEIINLFSASVG